MTAFPHGETVTVIRSTPGGVDRYGDPLPAVEVRIEQRGCAVWIGGLNDTPTAENRSPLMSDFTVIGPPDWDVTKDDDLEVRGHRCRIDGIPHVWHSPFTGWTPGTSVSAFLRKG